MVTDNPFSNPLTNAGIAGLGVVGFLGAYLGLCSQRREDNKVFRSLNLAGMTPKELWNHGKDYGRQDAKEIREGIRKCYGMHKGEDPPHREVRAAIWAHWLVRTNKHTGLGTQFKKEDMYQLLLSDNALETLEEQRL